ncbi:Ig-like domain repeat protein [Methanobrevibacter sp.]|uniref:Ig-like domain repeat protein n=1 Tax=Methanobrevibacter sp. TaxID=66852 RepID=UPI003890D789
MKQINKNIFICALLVVMVLFCISTASAEEITLDNNLASDDAGEIVSASGDTIYVDSSSTSDDEQGTESSPYKTISAAVNSDKVTGGETIFIKNGNYSESSVVKITKSLSIVGESKDGVSLKYTGDVKGNLIESNTQGISISFANMTFKDSETTTGSGIIRFYGNTPIDVNFTDCTFTNIANKYGALQFANTGTVNIEGCTFSDLTSKSSNGATGVYASAGATFNIKDTVFEDLKYESTGGQNGAVVFMSNAATTLNMDNVTIQRFSGAANSIVRSTGTVNIKKSKFVDNDVQLSSAGYVGDSLFYIGVSGKLTMEQSILANNTVAKNVFYLGSNAKATMNYNNIYNNTFNTSYESGIKTNNGVLDAENNYWGSNTLPEGVTANVWVVEEDGSYKLSNGNELEKEIPGLNDGGDEPVVPTVNDIIYVDSVNGADTNDGFSETTAVKTIEKAVAISEEITDDLDEGQIPTIVIKEGTYVENPITVTESVIFTTTGPVIWDANGKRALYVQYADVSLSNITFINGNESYNGAVIRQQYGIVLIDNCVFTNNGGQNREALIYDNYGALSITNTVFDKNTAHKTSTSYGNIRVNNGNLYVNNCNFTNNYNKYGVFYISSSQAEIYNSSFIGNNATSSSGGSGAGIYVGGTSTTQSTSSGKISNGTASNLLVKNCEFINNTAFGGTYYGGAGGAVYVNNNATAVIEDSLFENNVAITGGESGKGGAIYASAGDITVNGCVFNDNVAEEGSEIYLRYYDSTSSYSIMIAPDAINKINVKDSVFNDDNSAIVVADNAKYAADVNENYWGSNDNPASKVGKNVNVENWVIMDAKVTPDNAQIGDNVTVDVTFDKLQHADDTVSEYSGTLPEMDVTVTSTSGKLNEILTVKDNKASVDYTIDAADDAIDVGDVSIPLVAGIIYVSPEGDDNNAGTEEDPVATIAHAIEISVKGKIILLNGTHKTGDLGTITKDLTIIGQGNAIIDAQNNNRVLYVGSTGDVLIENVTLINGYTSADESGALFGNSGKLTIQGCTLANSTSSKNGGAIYNVADLMVIDSVFENNKAAQNGGAIFSQAAAGFTPELYVVGTTFTNNNAKGSSNFAGGAIFAQQNSAFDIINSEFVANSVDAYGGGAIEIVNTNVATITGSTFTGNSAKGEDSDSNYGGGAISFIGAYSDKKETLTVTDSLFEQNTVDGLGGGAIYVRTATVNVANSVLVSNYDDSNYAVYSRITSMVTPTVTVNDNWWGSNDSPKDLVSNKVTLNRWAVLTVTNDTQIKAGENVTINANINTYTTGSTSGDLAKPIVVPRAVTLETSDATEEDVLVDGEADFVYTVPEGLKFIRVSVDNEVVTLFVTTTATTVSADNFTAKKGERYEFTANVTCDDGTIVNQGTVELFIGEESIATFDVINGTASGKLLITQDEGEYNITVKYVDPETLFEESFDVVGFTVKGMNNIITPENFYDFFDEDGFMLSDIPFDNLVFDGEFEDLGIDKIVISESKQIESNYADFNDVVIVIDADDVSFTGRSYFTVDGNAVSGPVIAIYGDNVTVENVNIDYSTAKDTEAYGILIYESDGVSVDNARIDFESNSVGTPGYTQHAIQIRSSSNVNITKGTIKSKLPACDVDFASQGIDQDLILAIGIQDSENIVLNKNTVTTDVTATHGDYPTVDSIMANNVNNLVISDNKITQTDKSTVGAGYSNAVDLYVSNNVNITGNTITINSDAGEEAAGTAYPIQLTGPYANLVIDGNTLTSISNGPTLGIYSQNYAGETDITVTNNYIDVTGLATAGNVWSLVSGMELQDTQAKIYNNTIYSHNVGEYDADNNLYGISYAQWLSGDHTFDIRDNAIFTEGAYAVYFLNAVNSNVVGNDLHGHDLEGDDAAIIKDGEGNVIENNTPPYEAEVIIDAPGAWIGHDAEITVTVTNATDGNVTIKVNDKVYDDLALVNGSATLFVPLADIAQDAINNVSVTYNGGSRVFSGAGEATFKVVNGLITNQTFFNYFAENGYLLSFVPEGATLDFQGPFYGAKYNVYINKPVNVISSKNANGTGLLGAYNEELIGTAVFDSGENPNYNWFKFNVVAGGDNTNITGISIINGDLFIQGASNVTVDNIYMKANMRGVGSGTGFLSIHSEAYNTVIKNSYFENGGTGSSCVVLGKGGKYATFDNNVFNITGSSGNVLSSNIFVGKGDNPEFVNYINNVINSHVAASGFMYGITVCGQGNVIENNTLNNFKGNAIINQYGATSTKNVYRNNTITGGGSMAIGTYSIVENNNVAEGALTVTEGCNFTGNTVKSLTISGKNVYAANNTVLTTVNIAAAAKNTTFEENEVNGLVTVNSNDNTIVRNKVTTETPYAIDLKSTSNNTVTYNKLSSADKMGDAAVNYAEDKDNNVTLNGGNPIMDIKVENTWITQNNTITIAIVNATGNVTVKVNNKEFVEVPLVDGAVTIEVDAADIVAGVNNVTVTYNGDDFINADTDSTTFIGLDNVVTEEIFYNYFDDYGFLLEDVPFDELIFKGDFDKLSYYIILDRPIKITGQDAVLKDIAIMIDSDEVSIDGLTLIADMNLGSLVTVGEGDVSLSNLNISYIVKDGDSVAIDIKDVENVNVTGSTVYVETHITEDTNSASAINVDGSSNILIDGNVFETSFPALYASNYDWDYMLMGLNTVNPIRIRASENITFTNNKVNSTLNDVSASYPTAQSVYVIGSENVLIDSNDFYFNDELTPAGVVAYLYVIEFGYDKNTTVSNNNFDISTVSGRDSNGAAYALQGVESEMFVIGNNITTVSSGPNLGFYVASMMGGSSEVYVADNIINVTGNATTSAQWALVSGIEITNGNAKIYNNTIYTYNKAGYVEEAPVHGVSYGQYMYGTRTLDVQNNTMYVEGTYTVSVLDGTKANVTGNTLYAHDLFGDDSVAPGVDGIVENNTPPFEVDMIIDGQTAWIGTNSSLTITVPEGTGNVTVKVGNRVFVEVPLVNGTVTLPINASDLVLGANDIQVTYNGDKYINPGDAVGNLQVIDGVITNETFKYYFDEENNNYLFDYVPEGATLDFQGAFLGDKYSLYINKPVNVISSTQDAVFDSNTTDSARKWIKFNVVEGANNTNITGISIINGDLFIQGASYVTVDDIDMKANMRGVGSGTGFLSIHSNAYYTTIKNSHFENGGTGSSVVVLGKGGKYATFDNNTFEITGSSGNVLSSNIFVGQGDNPEFVNYTNNKITSHVGASGFMYGITVCGQGNIIENNSLINFKGNGIVNQFGATSTKNVYRNNTITGGGSMAIGTYSLVENNNVAEGSLTVTEGCTFVNNTAKALTVSGKNVVATDNQVATTVTISAAATNTTFANNTVFGLVTVNSNANTITENTIITDTEFAVDLKSTKNNTVTDNILYASELVGDKAVNFVEDNDNTVENNFPVDPELVVEVENIKVGENATINVSFTANVTGTVEVIVDGKKYNVDVVDGKGQLIVSDLAANKYTVGAYYDGDLLYSATENTTSFTVEKETTEANITVPSDVKAGEEANVTISIPGATGNVSVIVDGVEEVVPLDENGTAVYTIPAVAAGDHSVVVAYPGDDTRDAVIKSGAFTADKETTEANVTIGEITPEGANVTVSIPGATGNVSVIVDGNETVVPLDENGTATYTIPEVTGGEHSVVVVYDGDDKHSGAHASATLYNEEFPTKFTNVTVAEGKITGILTFPTGDGVANATIGVTINGVASNVTTDANGQFIVEDVFGKVVELNYAGNGTILPADISIDLTGVASARQATQIIGNNYTQYAVDYYAGERGQNFTTQLVDIMGNPLVNKTVYIGVNGVMRERTTDANGFTSVQINFKDANRLTFAVAFLGDEDYNATMQVYLIIIEKKPVTITAPAKTYKATAKTKKYTVTLKTIKGASADGKTYFGAGKKVTMKINGKTYTAKTNAKGQATFSLKITKKGKFAATIKYAGDTTYKAASKSTKITIK